MFCDAYNDADVLIVGVVGVLACACVGLSLLLLVREEGREREGEGGKDKETSIRIFMSINWKEYNYMQTHIYYT
jgi:hypothetical protein